MKAYLQNTLYIQKKDLLYLLKLNLDIPKELKDNLKRINLSEENIKLDREEKFKQTIKTETYEENKDYIRFTSKKEIDYYINFPWIIDYDEYKDLTLEELMEEAKEINYELRSILKKEDYNNKTNLNNYKLLALKLQSLRDFFWLKRGFTRTKIPIDNISKKIALNSYFKIDKKLKRIYHDICHR